jgi:hypothetical protein
LIACCVVIWMYPLRDSSCEDVHFDPQSILGGGGDPSRHRFGHSRTPNERSDCGSTILTMSGQTDPTSTGKPGHCVFCPDSVAIYTCPRCETRTCSQPCSTAHKTRMGCSGVREKAKFVPMNRYTCGTMMDDYVFLEDMSRKVGEWGQDLVRGGYGTLQGRGRRGRAKTAGTTGPPGRTWSHSGMSRKKRDILKSQLELRDIEMDLLPSGMKRRSLNQSTWDSKYVGFAAS